jgi:hypothetical protein
MCDGYGGTFNFCDIRCDVCGCICDFCGSVK